MTASALPSGFVHVTAGRCTAVVLAAHEADARAMLAGGSLYEVAARDVAARTMAGRGPVYAVALPVSGARVVVRRNRHGGLFARLTGDLFLPPTRAPYELSIALRLRSNGIPSPEILMYGITPAAMGLRRADVVSREIEEGRDLATFLFPDTPEPARAAAWDATRRLVRAMNEIGARHHDLNVKNVLIAPPGPTAYVLDVDRVSFGPPRGEEVRAGNVARLLRSARKWRDVRGALFDEGELLRPGLAP